MRSRGLSVILVLVLCGCVSTFKETHYFKSRTAGGAIPNYYRLTVGGYSVLSSSRYISGYFDEETVNAYFNEYTQPAGAAIQPGARRVAAPGTSGQPAAVEPVASGLAGQKLVMILSSNSDDVATQLGALAASRQFTASLAGLVARDQFMAADRAESRLAVERSRAKATASLASQLLAGLPDTATQAAAEGSLLAFVNALAGDLGYEGAFPTLDAAAQWLEFNRARLLRSE
jgi:hypothetical protein